MLFQERRQSPWLDDLDLLSPSEQVPRHLQQAAGTKSNDQRSVGLRFEYLVGVEEELRGVGRRLRREFPDDIDRLFVEDAERSFGVFLNREPALVRESLRQEFDSLNVGKGEFSKVPRPIHLAPGDEVMPCPKRKP